MSINRSDVNDQDFVDALELASDESTSFKTGVAVVSTTAATKTVVVSGFLLIDPDSRVEARDLAVITGSAAAGTYHIATVVDEYTFTVTEAIADSTGGQVAFRYPAGATYVGFNSGALEHSGSSTVDGVVGDIDAAMDRVKISAQDTTPGYLEPKLTAGAGITLTKKNVGGNENIEINTSGQGVGNVKATLTSVTADKSTTSTSFVDLLELSVPADEGNKLLIRCIGSIGNSKANVVMQIRALFNGVSLGGTEVRSPAQANRAVATAMEFRISDVAAGPHTIKIQWLTAASSTAYVRPVAKFEKEQLSLVVEEVGVTA